MIEPPARVLPVPPDAPVILMPTVEHYRWAAELSLRWLDRFWPSRPALFLCGLRDLPRTPANVHLLPLRSDPSDWMQVVRDACHDLSLRHVTRVYLILDDQGPAAPCHAEHLDRTIPRWMNQLDAAMISLRGWDHRNAADGTTLGPRYLHLQRQDPLFPWKFALHPALWRLDVLRGILDILLRDPRPDLHTPWKFETRAGKANPDIPPAWSRATYRICGRAMMRDPLPPATRDWHDLLDGTARYIKSYAVAHCSKEFNTFLNHALGIVSVFYRGPFPWHFNGFVWRGRLNPHLLDHLHRTHQPDLLDQLLTAFASRHPPDPPHP